MTDALQVYDSLRSMYKRRPCCWAQPWQWSGNTMLQSPPASPVSRLAASNTSIVSGEMSPKSNFSFFILFDLTERQALILRSKGKSHRFKKVLNPIGRMATG